MPFELGVDLGVALAGDAHLSQKRQLVLAEEPYHHQVALSDLAGFDVRAHDGDFEAAMRHLRAWLASLGLTELAPSVIVGHYIDFLEWDYERLLDQGWDEDDIQERPSAELLVAMGVWVEAGRPATY